MLTSSHSRNSCETCLSVSPVRFTSSASLRAFLMALITSPNILMNNSQLCGRCLRALPWAELSMIERIRGG